MTILIPSTARSPTEVIADALSRATREKPLNEYPFLSEWVVVINRHIEEAGWKLVKVEN